mgnify:CR=1 FL=1
MSGVEKDVGDGGRWTAGQLGGGLDGQTDRVMDGWKKDECIVRRGDGNMDGWIDRWMDRWTEDGRMPG